MPHDHELLVVLRKELEDSRIRVTRAACVLVEASGVSIGRGASFIVSDDTVAGHDFLTMVRAQQLIVRRYGELLGKLTADPR